MVQTTELLASVQKLTLVRPARAVAIYRVRLQIKSDEIVNHTRCEERRKLAGTRAPRPRACLPHNTPIKTSTRTYVLLRMKSSQVKSRLL